MSTRSHIGIKHRDGTYSVVYCHFDGYIDHNGKILFEHYTTLEKAKELLSHGDISSLAPEIGTKHDFDNHPKGECNFYGRDRGESNTMPKSYRSHAHLNMMLVKSWAEFIYLFDEELNQWYYTHRFPDETNTNVPLQLIPLSEEFKGAV